MAVMATRKPNGYVVTQKAASSLLKSKASPKDQATIKERAEKFRRNNLKLGE